MASSNLKPLNRDLFAKPVLKPRVLQFGEGNFLRAFVDWMIQQMYEKAGFDSGLTIIQPIAHGMVDILNSQDGLYTVSLKGIRGDAVIETDEVITCVHKGINPYLDFGAFLQEAENPALRFVVSNTTEAGIAFDTQSRPDDTPPGSFPAKVTVLLFHRFTHFNGDPTKGCIFLPCELIDRNGDNLKRIILQYADLWGLEDAFVQWVKTANIFCNTLVDRIVPGFPHDRIERIWEDLKYRDNLVVEGEEFHLWVIEGPKQVSKEFPAREAGLNVIFTDNLEPYRTRKVRILNGAHTSMVPVGYLAGLRTVKETVEDPVIGKYIRDLIFEEIIPTLDLPEEELRQFAGDVLDRFRNPFIRHELISIALNSVSKFKTRVLPSLLEYERRYSKLPGRIVFAFAALICFYNGNTSGVQIPLKDDVKHIQFFRTLWDKHASGAISTDALARSVLEYSDGWGVSLAGVNGLWEMLGASLEEILSGGSMLREI